MEDYPLDRTHVDGEPLDKHYDIDKLVPYLSDINTVLELLPPEGREKYEKAQQSVVDARRAAEREAGNLYIS